MLDVRANTQVIVPIGPFVDVGDGFTPETGVTLSGADEAELLKHGSTTVVDISGATWAAITSMDGHYALTLTTSHTDTEGQLTVVVQDDSVCLPVRMHFRVLSEAAYDSLYVAKDDGFMDVNIKTIGRADTQETEASNLEAAAAAYSATRGLAGTALPAFAADAAGGLPISDAGGLDLDAKIGALTYTVANKVDANISTVVGVTPTVGASLDFPTQIASRTNITGGTITTVTNLTNAPTNGDLTATMKTSVTTAATAATPIAASVSGNVDGSVASVVGAVGSVTGAVGSVTGAVGSVTGAVGSVTGNVGGNVTGSVGSLATQAKADVNGEVVDCLNVDTYAEPAGAPAATSTLRAKIGWIFKLLRNKRTQTSTTETLLADDGTTADATSTKSDDGTTATRGEWTA